MNQKNLGALFIVASAAGFATLAIFIKFTMAAGANITTILSGRFLLAGLFLFLVLKARNISARIDSKLAIQLCLPSIPSESTSKSNQITEKNRPA